MKKRLPVILIIVAAFFAGVLVARSGKKIPPDSREVLYWVDPMHPSYTADSPGTAPDCGMPLEPVYAGADNSSAAMAGMPPGTVKIDEKWRQLMGVNTGTVEKKSFTRTIRLLGRVAADETRIYRLNSGSSGWITKTLPNSAGSQVAKNEILATFYTSEFLTAIQSLLYALNNVSRTQSQILENPEQIPSFAPSTQYTVYLQQYKDTLRNLGMSDFQIDEIVRTKKFTSEIYITSPTDGFILSRTVSQNERFEKGAEFYRIADLSRVWIYADIFENEAQFFTPGVIARVVLPQQNKSFDAVVSSTLPLFDPVSRTLKVRLEADNPEFLLKPDMFVDVEFPITYPDAVSVPAESVMDTGLSKTVYVDRGSGYFEPRLVETGWRSGNRVEILAGLVPGERIVTSGNFLIDSESRLQNTAHGRGPAGIDPVCLHAVDLNEARSRGMTSVREGRMYFFCSAECRQAFDTSPGPPLPDNATPPDAAAPAAGTPEAGLRQ